MLMPLAANGRSYAIRSVRHTAKPEEKINRVIAIAAGLPMYGREERLFRLIVLLGSIVTA